MPTKAVKTKKTTKAVAAKKAPKAVKKTTTKKAAPKTAKAAVKKPATKAAKPAVKKPATKAVKDAREANRLRQQRFLEKHRDEINEKRRKRYAARKKGGSCPRCGAKLKSQKFTLCKNCLEKARDYNQR